MNRIIVIGTIFFLAGNMLWAQTDSISLRLCLRAARENAVIAAQIDINKEIAGLKTKNTSAANLPSINAFGNAWYQSDAISVLQPGGGGIEIDRFQYTTGLELSQKLYDGGMSAKSERLELAVLEAELGKIETELYQLNKQVADLYFNCILITKQSSVIDLKEELLKQRINEMRAAVKGGVITKNDLQKLEAELLLLEQQKVNLARNRQQLVSSLETLTGLNLKNQAFRLNEITDTDLPSRSRPEEFYFMAEQHKLDKMVVLQQSKNLPKLYAYTQGGYRYPGLNFFENKSDYYYLVGAKLAWTIFDWKQNHRETEIIRKRKESVAVQQADFKQKISMAQTKERINLEQLEKLIELDQEIIAQRTAVTRGSEKALEQGTITSGDFLEDLNAEMKARLDAEAHKIELLYSQFNLKLIEGVDLSTL